MDLEPLIEDVRRALTEIPPDQGSVRLSPRHAQALVDEIGRLRAGLAALRSACTDCGNNPCIFAERPLRGLRTQGGCRCRDNIRAALTDTAPAPARSPT